MEVQAWQLILIVLYGFFINYEKNSTMFGTYQPVAAGFVVGLIMGDVKTGLFIGGTLQLMSLGISNFGGASIPDYQTASVVATFITISTGQDPNVGITIGIPVALLMVQLDVLRNTIGVWLAHKAEGYADKREYNGIARMQMLGVILTCATTGVPILLATIFGPDLVNALINKSPEWLLGGLQVAGGILPAVGIALLLKNLPTKDYFAYLLIGFVITIYLELPLLGVALIAAAIALIEFKRDNDREGTVVSAVGGMDEDE